MTICIGVLCADASGMESRVAVVASDRMVTFGGITEFEHEIPKIANITDRVVALTAGDALRGSRLVKEVKAQIPGAEQTPAVRSVAEACAARYGELRRQQIESEIFRPRGIEMQQFYQGQQQRMIQPLVGALDEQVANFNYGLELLLAGTDDRGAHLYSVLNPGDSFSEFHQIGFHAIGSGMLHALQSIIGFGHTGRRTLPEALYTAYASKRRAEVAPGVGLDTDLAILSDSSITWLKDNDLKELKDIYDKYQKPVTQEIKTEVAKLTILKAVKGGEKQK